MADPLPTDRFCKACGYLLTSFPDFCTCPECGRAGAKELIACPPAQPLPTWPRFLLGLFGIPLGTLALGVLAMYTGFRLNSIPTVLISVLILVTALVLSLLLPISLGIHWAVRSTMPFQRRRRILGALAIFLLGAIVNLAIALPVIQRCLNAWAPTN